MVKQKWVAVFVLVALLLSSVLSIAQASEDSPSNYHAVRGGSYQEIFAQYGLQPAESIPPGVTPFRVESPAELALLMERLTAPTAFEDRSGDSVGTTAFNSPYCVAVNWGTGQARVYADVDISSGFVTKLYGVRVTLVGATLGFSLSSPWGYFTSRVPSRYVSWTGGGTFNTHLIVSGLPVIRSQPISCSRTFWAP